MVSLVVTLALVYQGNGAAVRETLPRRAIQATGGGEGGIRTHGPFNKNNNLQSYKRHPVQILSFSQVTNPVLALSP